MEGDIPDMTPQSPLYDYRTTTYLSSSEGMTTFAASTQTNDKRSCEEVVVLCKDNDECKLLLEKRDDQCTAYQIMAVETCTVSCINSNKALMMNSVGRYLRTCKFSSRSEPVLRLRGLVTDCADRASNPTTTPFTVEDRNTHSSLPVTNTKDCATSQDICKKDAGCLAIYHTFTTACSPTIMEKRKCSVKCKNSINLLESNMYGSWMLNCKCSSDQCRESRENLMRACRSDIAFSTDNYSVPPSTESVAVNIVTSDVTVESVTCEGNEMLVTLSIDPERPQPDVTATDASCRAEYRTGNTMQLVIPERGCGTTINKTGPGQYLYTNKLQITQAGGRGRHRFSKTVSCTRDLLMQQRQIEMSFFKDANFEQGFDIYPQTIQSTEHVYVEMKGDASVSLFVEECTATPTNSRDHKSSLMYQFLQNGCKTDYISNLKFYNTPNNNTKRFSLKAFGFQSSKEVFMHCELAICYNGESDCEQHCNTERTETDKVKVYQGPYIYNSVLSSADSASRTLFSVVGVLVLLLW